MAQTIDNVTLKINVEGRAAIDQTTASLDKSSQAATRTKQNYDNASQGIGNFGFQIQDMAVQLEMGTDALRVMGQQLPQMLSGFGMFGIVVGTLAAVGIPLFRVGMQAAGVDMRNLTDHSKDLETAVKNLHAAQETSRMSLSALQRQYGSIGDEAQRFYGVNLKAAEAIKKAELASTIAELKDQYGDLGKQLDLVAISQADYTGQAVQGAAMYNTYQQLIAWWNGLNIDQAQMLGKELKNLNVNSKPEELVDTITRIQEKLLASADASSEAVLKLKPILEILKAIAQASIESEANMKAQAQAASQFAAEMYNLQAAFIPRIGAARRAFDQINAARLEGEMKIAEFRKQAEEKSAQDGINRAAEVGAFTNRINAETRQKILDIRAAQEETFISVSKTNEARARSLGLESQLLTIKSSMRGQLAYEVAYEQEIAKATKERQDALSSISEQLRKNQITEARAAELRANVLVAEQKQTDIAKQRRDDAITEARIKQESSIIELSNKNAAIQLDMQAALLLQQNRTVYPEILEAQNRINKLKADAAIAEAAINREVELGNISRADGEARIAKTNEGLQLALELEKLRTEETMRRKTGTAMEGAEDAMIKILREGMSAYEQAGAAVTTIFNGMNSAIDDFVNTGKFKFSDFARSIIADLIKIELKAIALNFLGALFPSLGAKLKIPGKAVGGPVMPRTAYMVGERGPELFIPNGAGSITPNHAMGGSTQVVYNINAVDAMSFKQMVARDPEFIYSVTQAGARRLPR